MSHTDEGTLHTYLDGELAAEELAQLQEHLATCAACRATLDVERATRARAHEILRLADPPAVVPPDFSTLTARRSATPPPGRARAVRPLLLPWAASLILALGAGWFAQELLRSSGVGGEGDQVAIAETESSPSLAPPRPDDGDAAVAAETRMSLESSGMRGAASAGPAPAPAVETEADARGGGAEVPGGVAVGAAAADRAVSPEEIIVTGAPAAARPTAAQSARSVVLETGEAAEAMAPPAPPPPPPYAPVFRETGWAGPWRDADRDGATRVLGAEPLAIGSLPVESISVAADGSAAVRIVQRLPGGETLQILQRRLDGGGAAARGDLAADGARARNGAAPGGEGSGSLEIMLQADLPADSLQRLREALR